MNSYSQAYITWYDYLNSKIETDGEYIIEWCAIDTLERPYLKEISPVDYQGEERYHRPENYYKPNNKVIVLWGDTRSKISELEFDEVEDLGFNTMKVRIGNNFGIIDTNGEFVFKPEYSEIRELDPLSRIESQLFYLRNNNVQSKNNWEIRNRNGILIYDGNNSVHNPSFGRFNGIEYLYFNNRVHYSIRIINENGLLHTAIGEVRNQPMYIVPGELVFFTSGYNESEEPLVRYDSYIHAQMSKQMSKIEKDCLRKIDAVVLGVPENTRKHIVYNNLTFFNLSLGKEIETAIAFQQISSVGWEFIFPISSSDNFEVKKYYYVRKCENDFKQKLDSNSNYSNYCENDQFALFDNEFNIVIPFTDFYLEQIIGDGKSIIERSVLEHFIRVGKEDKKTSIRSYGLCHLKYGMLLEPLYKNIGHLYDHYRPFYVGKFWEVELMSGYKKVYNVEERAFVLEGKEFDYIWARRKGDHQVFFGVIDGVEHEIFF